MPAAAIERTAYPVARRQQALRTCSIIGIGGLLFASTAAATDSLPVSVGTVGARVLSLDRLHVDRMGRCDLSLRYDASSPHLESNGAHLLTEQVRLVGGAGVHLGGGWYSTLQVPMLLRQSGFDPTTGRALPDSGIESIAIGIRSALLTARYLRVGTGVLANVSTGAALDPYGGTSESTLSPWASLHTGAGRFDTGLAIALLPRSSGDAARSTIDARLSLSDDIAVVSEFAAERAIVSAATAWGALAGTVIQVGPELEMRTLFGRDIHFAPNGTRVLAAVDYRPRPNRLALPAKAAPRPSIADFERWERFLAEEAAPVVFLVPASDEPPPPPLAATITNEATPPPPGEGWKIVEGRTQSTAAAVSKGWVEVLSEGAGIAFNGERLDIRSDPSIQELAATLKARPEIRVRIEVGVAASDAPAADFRRSQSRADHLRGLLLTYGLEGRRIDAVGFGSGMNISDGVRIVVIE